MARLARIKANTDLLIGRKHAVVVSQVLEIPGYVRLGLLVD